MTEENLEIDADEPRQVRLARRLLRQAASYDDSCFQMWLWYPLPDGSWEILFGETGGDYHINLWETTALPKMCRAWGVDPHDLATGLGESSIPTGYIDFETTRMMREIKTLVIPDPLPPGWTESRLRGHLRCSDEIHKVSATNRRASQPEALSRLLSTLRELQQYRPV